MAKKDEQADVEAQKTAAEATEAEGASEKKKPLMSEADMRRKTARMAEILAAQPKRKIKLYQVPKGSTEAPLDDEIVTINGHTFQIQRGVEVEVPEGVAEVLEQAGRL